MNNKTNEDEIVGKFIEYLKYNLKNGIVLDKPTSEDYKDYKYDLIAKKEGEAIALIEAKYRSNEDRPTTDALIASFWKLLWEWGEKYCFSSKVKLIFIIFIKNGNLGIDISTFRNSIFSKFKCFGKRFCNKDIPLYIFSIKLELKENGIEFNKEDIKNFKNFIQNIEESKNG